MSISTEGKENGKLDENAQHVYSEIEGAGASPQARGPATGEKHECVGSCGEHHGPSTSTTLECQHTWCLDCLNEFVWECILEDHVMPGCCDIPLHVGKVVPLLDDATRELFWEEFEMLNDGERLYCYKPGCYSYISNKARTDAVGQCKCGAQTCKKCEAEAHPGKECPEDEHLTAFKTLVEKEGLRQCPVCTRAIQRNGGCSSMACVCSATFCYTCGLKISCLEGEYYCVNPDCLARG